VTSVVEDHFLETISSTEWKHGEEDADFSYITEKYNHFLTNLALADEQTVHIIFAVERDGHLMVSSIGESEVILQEPHASPSNIHEDTSGHHRFELISSGDIPMDSSVFIASKNLEGVLWDSFYSDCSLQESSDFALITKEVLSREVHETVHLVRIRRSHSALKPERTLPKGMDTLHLAKEKFMQITEKALNHRKVRDLKDVWAGFFEEKQNILMSIFFIVGVIIFFGLVSYLISALFGVTSGETKDAKNQIINAKTLIESSQKLISNPSAFDSTITDAEKILSDLESKQLYTKDVQDLRNKIEAIKKEIYDIQTVDLSRRKSLIPFDPNQNSPIGIYEREKKLYVIGKQWAIVDYAVWDTNIKVKSYPSGEVAKDYAVLDDGNFYILTEWNRIIASRKNSDISYINVTGQEGWEAADGMATFNGNIYLWNSKDGQIYKHKPGLNGFSAKSNVLPNPSDGIVDVGIDGGFYILKNDQKIIRLISSTNTQSGITLNKIPGEYTVGKNPSKLPHIIVRSELNYIYILDGNRVWVFLPDSKRFQDIRSWTYVAQIELSTEENIRDIAVARDGLIYVATDKWVYDVVFEFVDNNIILRS
jgi:hypothetical protein